MRKNNIRIRHTDREYLSIWTEKMGEKENKFYKKKKKWNAKEFYDKNFYDKRIIVGICIRNAEAPDAKRSTLIFKNIKWRFSEDFLGF